MAMGQIDTYLSIFSVLACDASISVTIRDGTFSVEGTIVALDKESYIVAESFGFRIESAAFALAGKYPQVRYKRVLSTKCHLSFIRLKTARRTSSPRVLP